MVPWQSIFPDALAQPPLVRPPLNLWLIFSTVMLMRPLSTNPDDPTFNSRRMFAKWTEVQIWCWAILHVLIISKATQCNRGLWKEWGWRHSIKAVESKKTFEKCFLAVDDGLGGWWMLKELLNGWSGEVRGSKCWAGKKNWRGFEKKCKVFENRVKSF